MFTLFSGLFLRIVSNPIANACQKKLGENSSSLLVNFYISLIMSVGCVIPVFTIDWTNYAPEFWGYVFLAGLFCSLGTICLIKALHLGELSILGPLNSYKAVIGLISAYLLLGELPTKFAICGVILIVFGSLCLINPSGQLQNNKKMWLSIGLRIIALIFTGCEASILKKIILLSSPQISFILWCFSGLVFGALFIPLFGKKLHAIKSGEIPLYILSAVCLSVMQFSTNIVFSRMEVGSALALFQLSAIINLFLGYKIFKEGGMIRKLVGTLIMITGSIIILTN